jgi:hypothetical protein
VQEVQEGAAPHTNHPGGSRKTNNENNRIFWTGTDRRANVPTPALYVAVITEFLGVSVSEGAWATQAVSDCATHEAMR